jgi:putative spermidine/putrescine transport system substrate-binding protein
VFERRRMGVAMTVLAVVVGACTPAASSGPTGGGATTAPTAAGGGSAAPSAGPTVIESIGPGEGELNLIVWPGYAESGANDPAYDWVHPFENQTGCQVKTIKEAGSSDEMVTLMRQGGGALYDGLSASGDATIRLIKEGLVAAVDVEKLFPEWQNYWGPMQSPPHNTVDGIHYGISHGWGANLLMWNTDVVTPAPDSWSVVFDPNSPYAGKVTAYDYAIYIADAALYLSKTQPDLGITDPYELTQPQFDASVALLKQQRKIIGKYWGTYGDQIADFEQGTSVLGTTWPYQVSALKAENPPIPVEATLPREGATGWADTWMLSSNAAHPNCMLMWMNWMSQPGTQQQVAEYFGEAPANLKACALIDSNPGPYGYKGFCNDQHASDAAYAANVKFWKTPLADCGDARGNTCVDFSEWLKAWDEIKASA